MLGPEPHLIVVVVAFDGRGIVGYVSTYQSCSLGCLFLSSRGVLVSWREVNRCFRKVMQRPFAVQLTAQLVFLKQVREMVRI